MKKAILLLVSGILVLALAGSAMAMPANSILINAVTGETISNQDLVLKPGDTLSVQFCVDAYTPSESNMTYDYDYKVTPWVNRDGVVLGTAADVSVDIPAPQTFYLPKITSGFGTFTDSKVITVTVENTAPIGAVYKITIGDVGFILTSASTNVNFVPEFPTVALPVAAILGLVFVFGRRKEGL